MNLVGWRKEEEKERGKKHRHSCIPVHSRWYTWYSQVKHMFGLFLLLNPCKHTELLPISFKDFDSRFSRSTTDQNSSKLQGLQNFLAVFLQFPPFDVGCTLGPRRGHFQFAHLPAAVAQGSGVATVHEGFREGRGW